MSGIMTMPPEVEEGSIEYKYRLTGLTDRQKRHLASQMNWRLNKGKATYYIGLVDDGFPAGLSEFEASASLESLKEIVDMADCAVICSVKKHIITHYAHSEEEMNKLFLKVNIQDMEEGKSLKWNYVNTCKIMYPHSVFERITLEVLIRKESSYEYMETRYGIAGHVDCGKSSLLGVLSSGVYDDGRGSARTSIVKLQHELETGRTTCVGQQIVGFDSHGRLVSEKLNNKGFAGGSKHNWSDITRNSSAVVTIFDLAGHDKYLGSTISGLSSNKLDYTIIVVGANMSDIIIDARRSQSQSQSQRFGHRKLFSNMTREHMELCISLNVQCIFVITKIDMVDSSVKKKTVEGVKSLIREKYTPYILDNIDNVEACVLLMKGENVIPIVEISNVTGQGHNILQKLVFCLPPRHNYDNLSKNPPIMQIQDIYTKVEGTSTVICGMLTDGTLNKGASLKIGPLDDGLFLDARVKSIQCKKSDVESVIAGKYICIGLPKAVDASRIKKNMFAVGASLNPKAIWEFWADIKLNNKESGMVSVGYSPYCFIGHIKQTCKILKIIAIPDDSKSDWEENNTQLENISIDGEARVLMRFCYRPELIFQDEKKKLIFKEYKTKGVGYIVKVTDTIYSHIDKQKTTHKVLKPEKGLKRVKTLRNSKRAEGILVL